MQTENDLHKRTGVYHFVGQRMC